MREHLLIDIGNTRLKWAFATVDGFASGGACLTSDVSAAELVDKHWQQRKPTGVLVSCVANTVLYQELNKAIAEKWSIAAELLCSPASGNGITNAYAKPEKLGSDRWAAMVGAFAEISGAAVCVVDCGTALTLDVINGDGQHQGGLIAPGLNLSRQCLQAGTQMKPGPLEAGDDQALLGRTTAQCIQLGSLAAICGLVQWACDQFSQQFGEVRLVLTGGDAALLQTRLDVESLLMPDLVLRGLAVIQASRVESGSL